MGFVVVVLCVLVCFGVFFYLKGMVMVGGEVWVCLVGDIFMRNLVVVGVMRLMWVFFL